MPLKPKGGYKAVAPYETTHVRVPVPLKAAVEKLIEEYRDCVLTGTIPADDPAKVIDRVYVDRVVEVARAILKKKKSARQTLAFLLTSVYNVDINPKDL